MQPNTHFQPNPEVLQHMWFGSSPKELGGVLRRSRSTRPYVVIDGGLWCKPPSMIKAVS